MDRLTISETYDFGEHTEPDGTHKRTLYLVPERDERGRPVDSLEMVLIYPPDEDDEPGDPTDGERAAREVA